MKLPKCPNCGRYALRGDNHDPKCLNVPEDYQKVVDRWSGTFQAYVCVDPACEAVFLTKQ